MDPYPVIEPILVMVDHGHPLAIPHQDQENHQQLDVQYYDLVSPPINPLSESYSPLLDHSRTTAEHPLHQNHLALQHVQVEWHFRLFNQIPKRHRLARFRIQTRKIYHHRPAQYALGQDGHPINWQRHPRMMEVQSARQYRNLVL